MRYAIVRIEDQYYLVFIGQTLGGIYVTAGNWAEPVAQAIVRTANALVDNVGKHAMDKILREEGVRVLAREARAHA